MASRINISYKVPDARATVKEKQFESFGLKGKDKKVSIIDAYTIDAVLNKKELEDISSILANPILEDHSIDKIIPPEKFDWMIEVGFLPGVTDNVGNTTKETIEDLLKKKFRSGESVYSSLIYFIEGEIERDGVEKIAYSLHNPLIQRVRIKT
ncbi:MAG: phosphoribosylformylglycinamidine synthase, partial [bacterium]